MPGPAARFLASNRLRQVRQSLRRGLAPVRRAAAATREWSADARGRPKVFVFAFLGEFGYELFNWQGVVRRFASTLRPNEQIVVASRRGLHPLYESATQFIDLSGCAAFQATVACCYHAQHPDNAMYDEGFDRALRTELEQFIGERLWPDGRDVEYIMSSRRVTRRGCRFGAGLHIPEDADIYTGRIVPNNHYARISGDLTARPAIEEVVKLDLSQPFVLVQTRWRDRVIRSSDVLPTERLLTSLGRKLPTLLLDFSTGRAADSYSRFSQLPDGCYGYSARSFLEQSCLIALAAHCVFLTEGDFGSHLYVPPFMGKDVVAIAPRSVYDIGTTPIEFWNTDVFQFGGQISPVVGEDLFGDAASLDGFVDRLLAPSVVRAHTGVIAGRATGGGSVRGVSQAVARKRNTERPNGCR